ncbi:MAG: type I methionyl aminopeptidase [Planctomycetota bacterium]|jgi:methionyl aminopeptidase|nr:type I methionyl aminopeptidase [Planctomycetota bacterium]
MRPDKIILKSQSDLEQMREAGRLVAQALALAGKLIAPGVTTGEINAAILDLIRQAGATATFVGYPSGRRGVPAFPAAVCASVNEQVVHGIPGPRVLLEGDILSLDIGVHLNGWCGDAARTFPVGKVGRKAKRLLEVTETSLTNAIANCRPGRFLDDISQAVESCALENGLSVVKQFVGHGIGRDMHEPPQVPNFIASGNEIPEPPLELRAGMVLAIEPMLNLGGSPVLVDPRDGWTVFTKDRSLSAHFEHSVAITNEGPWILTEL